MSILNPVILFGLGLASIPVILHLLMRNKPKKLLFPALRLIQVRRKTNVRRMRLRHIWLMLLRVAVIALLVLALARPSLPAADYSLSTYEWAMLAAIATVAAVVYWSIMRLWRKNRLPNHVLSYRRTMLRGGTGGGILLLLLLLVVWPYCRRVSASVSDPQPNVAENIPVAGVFLFDTSISMEYRQESKTRLDVAKQIASEHLGRLPRGSRIAVAETASDSPILFQADLGGAQARIDTMQIQPVSLPLNDRLRSAARFQNDDRARTLESQASIAEEKRRDRYVRAVYVFTDLAAGGWRLAAAQFLRDELSRYPWIHIYLIDVSVESPQNVAISSLTLSKQTLALGGDLIVDATLDATGTGETEQTVELWVQNKNGDLTKQGKSTVKLDAKTGARVPFTVHGLTGPVNHGEVRISSSDPLPTDNIRHFTIEVRPPPEILVVTESRAAAVAEEAVPLIESLSPAGFVQQGKARYRCTPISVSQWGQTDLQKFDVICLVNVAAPTARMWDALEAYIDAGGGLAVFLGNRRIDPVAYNENETARQLLPGKLLAYLKFTPPEFLDLQDLTHPILKKLAALGGAGELTSAEVRRYWRVRPYEQANVIAEYSDSRSTPALLERLHGSGRTVVLTTAIGSTSWNDLPLSWQYLALADQTMQYLGRRAADNFNYTVGDDVLIRLNADQPVSKYLLRKPSLQQIPGEAAPGAEYLTIRDANEIGHYEIVAVGDTPRLIGGFSANVDAAESDFRKVNAADFDLLLGENRYSLAKSIAELQLVVSEDQLGKEVYPTILFFLLIVFCGEHLVANRFYDADSRPTQ